MLSGALVRKFSVGQKFKKRFLDFLAPTQKQNKPKKKFVSEFRGCAQRMSSGHGLNEPPSMSRWAEPPPKAEKKIRLGGPF